MELNLHLLVMNDSHSKRKEWPIMKVKMCLIITFLLCIITISSYIVYTYNLMATPLLISWTLVLYIYSIIGPVYKFCVQKQNKQTDKQDVNSIMILIGIIILLFIIQILSKGRLIHWGMFLIIIIAGIAYILYAWRTYRKKKENDNR